MGAAGFSLAAPILFQAGAGKVAVSSRHLSGPSRASRRHASGRLNVTEDGDQRSWAQLAQLAVQLPFLVAQVARHGQVQPGVEVAP